MSRQPIFPNNPLITDVLKIVGGTTIAQAMTIIASPVVARLYGPESFGLSAIFASITGIIGVIVCLRYELAIMLPEKNEDAMNILALSLLLTSLISAMTVPAFWLCQQPLLKMLNAPGLDHYIWLMPASIFMTGVFLALNYWNSRTRHFGRASIARVGSTVASTVAQLGAGFTGHATGGSLIIANLVGSMVFALVAGGQIWQEDGRKLRKCISIKSIKDVFWRYKRFPIIDTWSALFNNISWLLPTIVLSHFFPPKIVGYYALGIMVIQLPMSIIGNAVTQVFFQRISVAIPKGNLTEVTESFLHILLIFGLLPMLILAIEGKNLFIVFFGNAWSEAGIYIQILSGWGFVWFISAPLSSVFSALERQEFALKLNLAIFSTRLLSLCIGGWLNDANLAIILLSISGIFVYGLLCYATILLSGIRWSNIAKIAVHNFVLLIPIGIALIGIERIEPNPAINIAASGILFVIYYLYMLRNDSQLRITLKKFGD